MASYPHDPSILATTSIIANYTMKLCKAGESALNYCFTTKIISLLSLKCMTIFIKGIASCWLRIKVLVLYIIIGATIARVINNYVAT